jgi:hypothetical protein
MVGILESHSTGDLKMQNLPAFVTALGERASKTLILFRRRFDALDAAGQLRGAGLPFRLRLGRMPRLAAPWFAMVANDLVLHDVDVKTLDQAAFDGSWERRCAGQPASVGFDREVAWTLLRRLGGGKRQSVDFGQVADALARGVGPEEAFVREPGSTAGPIIGNIHCSKGREAPDVVVLLDPRVSEPDHDDVEAPEDEEARVLYVAVSRAKELLVIRSFVPRRCGYFEGRAWSSSRTGMHIELGLDGDIDATSLMRLQDGQLASGVQQKLEAGIGRPTTVFANADKELGYIRKLVDGQGGLMGALSSGSMAQLGGLVAQRGCKKGPPMNISHLTWLDTSSFALPSDSPRLAELKHPWNETRLWLSPVVLGAGWVRRYW